MKILITGANGYIGKRIIPSLLEDGHDVVCCVRDRNRINLEPSVRKQVTVAEADFLDVNSLENLPGDIDVAYYLIHSMTSSITDFMKMEEDSAANFVSYIEKTTARQTVYLTGLINDTAKLSSHLQSRLNVEKILISSSVPATVLRAGIIVGSGSASFEIIRDLVEKLPAMITPRWLKTRTQPIAIRDILQYLRRVAGRKDTYNQIFDIGGPDVMTYKEMLLQYAEVRGLKRAIWVVPVMTPRLSSYWLYFVTSTSYKLAVNLVDSMKVDVVCREESLKEKLAIEPTPYKEAIRRAFEKIEQNAVVSSWKDAFISSSYSKAINDFIQVPQNGGLTDRREVALNLSEQEVLDNIWSLGGKNGWFYADKLWAWRGFLDKMVGGVGLRRGRTNPDDINPGDALDFWRVIVADKDYKRLLLFAEMKMPGEAWLEFKIDDNRLIQTATFRPKGLAGRLYWYMLVPFHLIIFRGMARRIAGF